MNQLPAPLAAMAAYRQFIVCQFVPDTERPGKTHKYPISIHTGTRHDAHDASIWLDSATACATASAWGAGYGVGFVFTEQDPFWFIDVDNCLDSATGQWTPIVHELCAALPGAAIEISQSGRGLHLFGYGSAPAERRKKDYTNQLFDLYTERRFVALTGTNIAGNMMAADYTPALYALSEKWLKRVTGADGRDTEWSYGPVADWNGPLDDAELLQRAMRSMSARGAFGGAAASFADLWECNVEVLAKAYPPDGNGTLPYDASRADRALAQHLMFWTGKDCERTRRLMLESGLARGKWERESYMLATILSAAAVQGDVLQDKPPEPLPAAIPPSVSAPEATIVTGSTILSPAQQLGLFSGCTYVRDAHAVLVKGGHLLKPDQFRVTYGGYTFIMDNENNRSSRDAWEAFTQSQSFRSPRADSSCFRPDLEPGAIVECAGVAKANTWWPVDVPRMQGDAGPFLRHLAALLPDERDRTIMLSYMAAIVQHKGVKFQWAPLLQGTPGNGKTLLSLCVAEAIGKRYVHWPKASKLSKDFNKWMIGNIFYGVEDIYVTGGHNQRDVYEELKPMITGGDGLEIEGKGVDQISADICGNFIFNTNHKDGMRIPQGDRRIAVFYTPQQNVEDLEEWGMTGDYFPRLYDWLRAGGFAIVTELLYSYQIPPEFNPAVSAGGLAGRAPRTSSSEEAIAAGLGGVEQEVLEAIEQGTVGFLGGFVSSMALDKLLERIGRAGRVPINKRRELMHTIGYEWHPGLMRGRVNNIVTPDGGKPVLFVKRGHPAEKLVGAAEIARAYSVAQMQLITGAVAPQP